MAEFTILLNFQQEFGDGCERRLYGSRKPALRSQFLDELPEELLATQRMGRRVAVTASKKSGKSSQAEDWQLGDRVLHKIFGVGEMTHIFGSGNKVSVAVKFDSLSPTIIDPKIAQLQKID